jgi:hypothetical protein
MVSSFQLAGAWRPDWSLAVAREWNIGSRCTDVWINY